MYEVENLNEKAKLFNEYASNYLGYEVNATFINDTDGKVWPNVRRITDSQEYGVHLSDYWEELASRKLS